MPEKSSATAVIEKDSEVVDENNKAGRAIPIPSLRMGVAVAVVVAVVAVLSWQWYSAASELGRHEAAAADRQHAEQVALDYATGAAQMSFENTQEWRGRLTANTTPELTTRLTKAATSMEQLIGPMQWSSTARPIAAKVESESGGIYRVVCFVDVLTKNVQAPDGVQSTATYKLDIDSGRNWTITEISGIDSALGAGAPR
jgi:Mce-associated membrane protein